ncbi:tyrosine--tRNA ligase [bacterium]|nr:tyrosine--tRNA ligase [bacterium]
MRRGVSEFIGEEELVVKLKTGKPLRIKYGADPSAPDLHLGHTVVLRKLRQLQEMGHTVQFLIGDFTGMIGDPTGRSVTRPPLTSEQIKENAQTYQEQVFKILLKEKTEIVFNSTWCNAMNFSDVIRLTARYTVARIIERDDFSKRFREGKPIGLHEFLYPLIQGYDSVVLKSDVELCGTDQIFNCLVARSLQQDYNQTPETIIAMPLLEGLDGVQKMSKSLGNYIGIAEDPKEMFGKMMSIPDALMMKYYRLLTDLSDEKLAVIENDLESGSLHPRNAKADLAKHIITFYHSPQAADLAAEAFDRVFKNSGLPEDIQEKKISTQKLQNGKLWVVKLLHESGLVSSKSEAQRMLKQGAVQINQQKISDQDRDIVVEDGLVIQVGKRKFVRIKLY